ncbi:MAG: hypothetical protein EAZ55_02865 [Cytophagales bacterium]|nr:MAG: hypothetical protein EAZ55_02865 [Cytophagales bacterium]
MKKTLILSILYLSIFSLTKAQNEACQCVQVFEQMTQKIEKNYIAYHLNKSEIEEAYKTQKSEFHKKSTETTMEQCTALLQDFLRFFQDKHVFAVAFPKPTEEELNTTKILLQNNLIKDVGTVTAKDIEGYWTDGSSKYAILPNPNENIKFSHVAIIIEHQDAAKIGEIKLGVSLNQQQEWVGKYYPNNYAERYTQIKTYKEGKLLNIWGGIIWARLDDKNTAIFSPIKPTLKNLNEKTVLIDLPSFLIEKKDFDDFLKTNENSIAEASYLIIDLRGNTGGNGIYYNLFSFFAEKSLKSPQGLAIASDDNIAYFTKFANLNQANDPHTVVVNNMKTNNGQIVKGPIYPDFMPKIRKSNIQKVVIWTDKGCMSAAEAFILQAKGLSTKVTTIGNATGGVIDYNNVNSIPISCERYGIYFGYPTYSMHENVKTQGYNKTGIIPDIIIETNVDYTNFTLEFLNK